MLRECSNCHRPFTRQDFFKDESRHLEADRKAAGLAGLRFFDYRCPGCGTEDVFVDVCRLESETDEEYAARRKTLEASVRVVQAPSIEVIVADRRAAN
jgi:hypothetical protein